MLSQMSVTGDAGALQLQGGQARTLQQRAGLVGVDLDALARRAARARCSRARCRQPPVARAPALQCVSTPPPSASSAAPLSAMRAHSWASSRWMAQASLSNQFTVSPELLGGGSPLRELELPHSLDAKTITAVGRDVAR